MSHDGVFASIPLLSSFLPSFSYYSGRNASNDCVRRHVFGHDRSGTYDGSIVNGHTRKHGHVRTSARHLLRYILPVLASQKWKNSNSRSGPAPTRKDCVNVELIVFRHTNCKVCGNSIAAQRHMAFEWYRWSIKEGKLYKESHPIYHDQ